MEESWTTWLCDLEPDDSCLINQSNTQMLQQKENQQLGYFYRDSYSCYCKFNIENTSSSISNSSSIDESSLDMERPAKVHKICTCTPISSNTEQLSALQNQASLPSSCILSFNNANPPPPVKVEINHERPLPSKGSLENRNNRSKRVIQGSKMKGPEARTPNHAYEHVIAERVRREKISQQFTALAALIPGLKKTDKASVLGEGIKYVKLLQEQVKLLEEQKNQKKNAESVVFVNKSHISEDENVSDDTSTNSCDGNSLSHQEPSKTNLSLPQVEARVSERNVLIRIHCEKQNGVLLLMNILRDIENLNLSVISSCALPFGTSRLDITIIAKMEDEFSLNVKELARKLSGGR